MGNITSSFRNCKDMMDVFHREKKGGFYARYFYETEEEMEARIAQHTNAESAALFNAGMGAIITVVSALGIRPGDRILVSDCLYSQTAEFFKMLATEGGVRVEFYSPSSESFYEVAAESDVKMIFTEVIGNGFEMPVADLPRLMEITKTNTAILVLDNTFLTPALLNVMDLSVRYGGYYHIVVVESGTKYFGLGGDKITLGIAYGSADLIKRVKEVRAVLGTYLQPVCLKEIPEEIFDKQYQIMRMHSDNAQELSSFLRKHYPLGSVEKVNYPELTAARGFLINGSGGVLYFSLKGGPAAVEKFCDALQKCKIGGSFGHPDTWVIPMGLLQDNGVVRVAVGWQQQIEEVKEDFKQALEKLTP